MNEYFALAPLGSLRSWTGIHRSIRSTIRKQHGLSTRCLRAVWKLSRRYRALGPGQSWAAKIANLVSGYSLREKNCATSRQLSFTMPFRLNGSPRNTSSHGGMTKLARTSARLACLVICDGNSQVSHSHSSAGLFAGRFNGSSRLAQPSVFRARFVCGVCVGLFENVIGGHREALLELIKQ